MRRSHYQHALTSRAVDPAPVAKGLADNAGKTSQIAADGRTLARRFRDHEDMILRFTTDLAVGFTSNQAERDVRPVKVQQRTSGGTWRTLAGLADFAVVRSYLSTAAKWGIDSLDALTWLFRRRRTGTAAGLRCRPAGRTQLRRPGAGRCGAGCRSLSRRCCRPGRGRGCRPGRRR